MNSNIAQMRRFMTSAAMGFATISVSVPAGAQLAIPAYMNNTKDPVQLYVSQALIGFSFQKKCGIEAPAGEASYERALNQANSIFQGYVLAKGFVTQPADAASYSREMAMGAIRFAAANACDEHAKDRVETGYRVAKDFQVLIAPYLNQPMPR